MRERERETINSIAQELQTYPISHPHPHPTVVKATGYTEGNPGRLEKQTITPCNSKAKHISQPNTLTQVRCVAVRAAEKEKIKIKKPAESAWLSLWLIDRQWKWKSMSTVTFPVGRIFKKLLYP
jgi:hypothetical protein